MQKKYNNILDQIGMTPLVPINRINPNKNVEILAKLECTNPGGSVKDRPALKMIEDAEASGELTKDKIILEATSGNTGIGLAMVAAVKGYRILLIMAESVSEERKKILSAMGAELAFTPAHMSTDGAIEHSYDLARKEPDKYWLADQFNNESNWKSHYYGTSMEIWEQTGHDLNMIISTMGTTGTLMGLSRRYKELDPKVEIIGIEPYLGHKIQGLKNMQESYRPEIFERDRADRIIHVDDDEAFQTARLLTQKEGIFCGMSSGAAMAGAIKLAKEMDKGRIVVILPDGGERYLSTPLFERRRITGQILYNTLSRKKEEFIPLEENRVKMYTCGPTLDGLIHIGQSRRFIFADLVRRYMEFKGFEVTHIVNVTDLDDRTIDTAEKEGLPLEELTDKYFWEFIKDMDSLKIKRADEYPKASKHVDEMIQLTGKLMDKGYAYEKFRSVYYDISRFTGYGRLSNIDLEKIRVGKTVDMDRYGKENPRDFTLLKRSTLNELKKGIYYPTQWGNVRPSWHVECPAMALKYMGEQYDIQTSSVELTFPHHENTIAISQAATGCLPANYWLYNELVMADGKNSSGSAKNDFTIREILDKGYSGMDIRYLLISSHYRKPVSFSWEKLDIAKKTISNLARFVTMLHSCKNGQSCQEIDQLIYDLRHSFTSAMDDDLNIAPGLAALFQFTGEINRIMVRQGLSADDKKQVITVLNDINAVISVMDLRQDIPDKKVEKLVQKRDKARRSGDWAAADDLRQELENTGIELIDTKDGTIWRRTGEQFGNGS
jgi:cysteinyl-tRNA synthetase